MRIGRKQTLGKLKSTDTLASLYLEKLKEQLAQSAPNVDYPLDELGEQAIIYVGGGKYWPGILTGIQMLRDTGCNLPVEVWHRPDAGESVDYLATEGMGVTYQALPGTGGKHDGWAAKLQAIYYSRYQRLLFLDADAYCVNDPLPLFDLLNELSFCYWEDTPRQLTSIKWRHVYPEGQLNVCPPVQGGQLLIDRMNAWKLIHIAKWICDNREYYFKYIYGDQDAWRVALVAGKYEATAIDKAYWRPPAFVCSYDEVPYIVHRCQGKLFRIKDINDARFKYSQPFYHLPKEQEVFQKFYQTIKDDSDSQTVFTDIYKNKLWGPYTGLGGGGSRPQIYNSYIRFINEYLERNGYRTIIDLGCSAGDVGAHLKCEKYIGYDCVKSAIDRAKTRFRGKCTFVHLDFFQNVDTIQSGDILLCRDVLHHWPNDMIQSFLCKLIKLNKWKKILLGFDVGQKYEGEDTHLGGYRPLYNRMIPLRDFGLIPLCTYDHERKVVCELPLERGE